AQGARETWLPAHRGPGDGMAADDRLAWLRGLSDREARMSVSAVINIYDEEPAFIAEAIDSVRAQSHAVDQIIVVEDGARRDYAALLARYPDIAVIRQPNAGLAAARNTGLAAARGDYVLFLDGDDRL